MNKKGTLSRGQAIFIMVMVCAFAILLGILTSLKDMMAEDNNCFQQIGKEYCSDEGLVYDSVAWFFRYSFYCRENERTFGLEEFRFTKEEVERCT